MSFHIYGMRKKSISTGSNMILRSALMTSFNRNGSIKYQATANVTFTKWLKIRFYLKIISLNWIFLTDMSMKNSAPEPTTCLWQGKGSGVEAIQIYYVPYVMITALEMKSISYLNVHIFKATKINSSQILFLKYNIQMSKLSTFSVQEVKS